jgi:amino acid transporter
VARTVTRPGAPPERDDLGPSLGYSLKRLFLGRPLATARLEHERLGKPTALAVFASDNLSSTAYATEEILRVLVPAVGLAAFNFVFGISIAIVVVEAILVFSYRQTIKAYPTAGGAYIVTRDNFGLLPAQVAGVALLTDYVLTVAVSISAGVQAITSVAESLHAYRVPIALVFIWLIAYGNLLGVRESGRIFAFPTYLFIGSLLLTLGVGLFRVTVGGLEPIDYPGAAGAEPLDLGMGAITVFLVLKAFASGGAAVTGVEAISNGVPAFRKPEWRNARQTLVIMGSGLAVMFLGLSFLASKIEVIPFEGGTPTVLAQIGEVVYGHSAAGEAMSNILNVATMFILVLAANTGFADFPRLANLQAGDSFLPRQLTKRGHRLVFSNGIIALAAAAAVLVIVSNAAVTRLIPIYAISVFTGFTLSQAGMTKHHLRKREPGFVRGILANGVGAVLSGAIVIIVTVTRFNDAWVVLPIMPLVVVILLRLNRQYERERVALETDVPTAAKAPILRRHVVMVFVDRLDLAAARAIQYARTLTPDELRAVHFVVDEDAAARLAAEWRRLGLARVRLEMVACPDRRLTQAAVEHVAHELSDGETEVSVLLPDRKYNGLWHRILHDRTAESIQEAVSKLPHANVTTVPFHLDAWMSAETIELVPHNQRGRVKKGPKPADDRPPRADTSVVTPIGDVRWRDTVRVKGQIRSVRVAPQRDAPTFEAVVDDGTGTLLAVFLGRRELAGVNVGTRVEITGTAGVHQNRLAILNPSYAIVANTEH